ncbi:DNA-binding response regulator [Gilvimarinus sp. SDUM040013]|uniref:DNA-binding response regulator n=1 Tax=Gilvimarinus gilvus TaxID=3058038 RepID=A0ABU4RT22_9GAMM|nr:DNA-binding response regulator [Gilvimarinus sp. SDUM040013]MDO3387068.1 DNA-binding response regulator [Gilvimarinus sp. SDUM040013]MDX6848038.1 DNA-binding response regulator [Gilvimarinus sp. SDUM040013]
MNEASSKQDVVLVVDDSIDSIRMISDVLEEAEMTVLVALEGSQALTITKNISPDIILLDAIMPNMDGFATCRALKENPKLMDVPIIFMTGLSDTEHVVMGLKSGGVDYITKPINASELVARMHVHLANARMTQSARMALDAAGQTLFAIDQDGDTLWATPRVYQLLARLPGGESENERGLQKTLKTWLEHTPGAGHKMQLQGLDESICVEYLANVSGNEHLLRLSDQPSNESYTDLLRTRFQVTVREADVLLWIANGKTNREIGQILEMSPRTVNKHLEQVFKKMGVENRTSAAAMAIRTLAEKG